MHLYCAYHEDIIYKLHHVSYCTLQCSIMGGGEPWDSPQLDIRRS